MYLIIFNFIAYSNNKIKIFIKFVKEKFHQIIINKIVKMTFKGNIIFVKFRFFYKEHKN